MQKAEIEVPRLPEISQVTRVPGGVIRVLSNCQKVLPVLLTLESQLVGSRMGLEEDSGVVLYIVSYSHVTVFYALQQ